MYSAGPSGEMCIRTPEVLSCVLEVLSFDVGTMGAENPSSALFGALVLRRSRLFGPAPFVVPF